MAEDWYCKISDQERGPLSADQLRALALQGKLSPGDPVRREGMDSWAPAGRVKGLFPPSDIPSGDSDQSLPRAKPLNQPPTTGQPPPPPPAPPISSGPSESTDGLEQFSIVTDDTGQSNGSAKSVEEPDRRKKRSLVVGAAVLAVGLVVGAVGVYLFGGFGADDGKVASKPSSEQEIPEDLPWTEDSVASVNASRARLAVEAKTAARELADALNWTDASNDSITRDDVTVRILSVELGRPLLVSASGRDARPKTDNYLILRLELSTQIESDMRGYAGWGSRASDAELKDNLNNTHDQKSWATVGRMIDGQVRNGVLEPGVPTEDVLVFGPWPEQANPIEYLRLQLPAATFGAEGSLRFEIPAAMFIPVDEPRVESSPAAPAAPEEPEEDIPVRDRLPIPGLHDDK